MLEDREKGLNNWAKQVKFILDISGFSCVWSNQSNINSKTFPI